MLYKTVVGGSNNRVGKIQVFGFESKSKKIPQMNHLGNAILPGLISRKQNEWHEVVLSY
ncbi:MAG: hypothetical protein WD491_13775 [Balneolales bacterium]